MHKKIRLGLIGKALGHSFSPGLFAAVSKARNLGISYELFEIRETELDSFFHRLRTSDFKGLNVTIPYKEKVISYLDEVDRSARTIGAVNVIKNDRGHLTGFNTDWVGFKKSLRKIKVPIRKALIFGAGGASRAVIYGLYKSGCPEIFVAVRSLMRGKKLLEDFSSCLELHLLAWPDERLTEAASEADLLVNATPIGLNGLDSGFQWLGKLILKNKIFIDLIYNPPFTDFMRAGCQAQAVVYNGVDMLLFQALESLKIWTGIRTAYREWRSGYEILLNQQGQVQEKKKEKTGLYREV